MESKTSSVVDSNVQVVSVDQFKVQTPYIIGFLFVVFIVLKLFIYIKDEKRDQL